MTVQTIKRMLDACYQAKRIREMLPALPSGVTPSYIHFLDVIQIMERQGVAVKISDISDYLNIPRPGVTRTVKEMEEKGYLRKANAAEDGSIGRAFVQRLRREVVAVERRAAQGKKDGISPDVARVCGDVRVFPENIV